LTFPFCPERSLTPPGETVVDYTHVPDQREAPRPLLPYRHEVVIRWELQDWTVDRPQRPSCPSVPSDNGVERHLGCVCVCVDSTLVDSQSRRVSIHQPRRTQNLGTTTVGTAGQIPPCGSTANQYPRGPN
jgi:hypothetical protein